MYKVNTRSTQSKGRVGFLQGANQWFKGGKGFVGTRVERARNDSFSEQGMVGECAKERDIGVELLLVTRNDRATSEEKLSTYAATTLSAGFGCCACSIQVTDLGN